MFLATADMEDIRDVSTWTNIAIIDRNNIDISTGHVIEGSNAKKITNPFTLQAIVKTQYDQNDNMSYTIVGREIQETDTQLMSRFVETEEGLKVYSNEIIEDVPVVYLTDGDIYRQVLKEYGYHQDGQAFLVKALALKLSGQSVDGYVKEKLANFKTTRWSFKSYDAQTKEEVARLEDEYNELQAIAKDYKDRLNAIEPMDRSELDIDGSFEANSEDIAIAGDHANHEDLLDAVA